MHFEDWVYLDRIYNTHAWLLWKFLSSLQKKYICCTLFAIFEAHKLQKKYTTYYTLTRLPPNWTFKLSFKQYLYKKMFIALVISEIMIDIINLFYTFLSSKIELSLLHVSCRDLSKKYSSELWCNLASSTFNSICLLKFCRISSILVRRKLLFHTSNYYIRKYFKQFY